MIELINHKNTDKFLPGRPLVAENERVTAGYSGIV